MSEALWGPWRSQQCPHSKMSSSVPANVFNTQWSHPFFSSTKIWQNYRKQVWITAFVLPKKVQAHQLKTLHAPAVIEGVCLFFLQISNCVYVKTWVKKEKFPPNHRICKLIGGWQNTQWHLVRFSPLEQISNSQYTYWSCNDRQNFMYNFLREAIRTSRKKPLSTPPKSWKSKRSGVKIVTND